jgi:hypothetical protein
MSFQGVGLYVASDERWQNVPPPDPRDWDSADLARVSTSHSWVKERDVGNSFAPFDTPP